MPTPAHLLSDSIRRELRHLAAAALFLLLAVALTACDVSLSRHHDSGGFTKRDQADFLNSCLVTSGGARKYCECSLARVQKALSFDELNVFIKAQNEKGEVSAKTVKAVNRVEFACGQSTLSAAEKKRNVYPEPMRSNLVKGCTKSNPGHGAACRCVLERMEKTTPLKDLIAADTALRVSQVANPKTLRKIGAASKACF